MTNLKDVEGNGTALFKVLSQRSPDENSVRKVGLLPRLEPGTSSTQARSVIIRVNFLGAAAIWLNFIDV
jgi:hypothetical protein